MAVLDVGLPDGSGTEVLRARRKSTPVLIPTARSGIDDCLVQPFDLRELEARGRALALTRREFSLFEILLTNRGRLVRAAGIEPAREARAILSRLRLPIPPRPRAPAVSC